MRERPPELRRLEYGHRGIRALTSLVRDFRKEITEGIQYTLRSRFALTILMLNIMWAMGGGATNLVFEGLGVQVFSAAGYSTDFVYALLLTVNGIGLSIGVLVAYRVGAVVELYGLTRGFMGWALVMSGVFFAIAGLMPTLWLVSMFVVASRIVIGAQFVMQETMFQRSLPDHIRGRISTLDRGAEITMFSISSYLAGLALLKFTAPQLTVVSGILAGMAGLVWFLRTRGPGGVGDTAEGETEPV